MDEVKKYFYSKISNDIVLKNIDNFTLLEHAEEYLENALADAVDIDFSNISINKLDSSKKKTKPELYRDILDFLD